MLGGVGGAVSDGRSYPDRRLFAVSFYRGLSLNTLSSPL